MTESLKEIVLSGSHLLAIENSGNIRTFDRRGITSLYELLSQEPSLLNGATVVDKVVGKGAAALMIRGGIKELYANVISEAALDLFRDSDVEVTYGEAVPCIMNRARTGLCPVETLCAECKSAEECLPRIKEFITKTIETANRE